VVSGHGWRRGVVLRGAVLACTVLAWCPSSFALNPSLDISQYAHASWKNSDGFAKGEIVSLAQTPDGYLWIGSEFGLLRFDGVRIIPWQPPTGQSLPSRSIRSLLAARDGTLWIGTLNGLASLKDGRLTQYHELAGTGINALVEGRDETVWIGGLMRSTGRLCAAHRGSVQCSGGNEDSLRGAVVSLYEEPGGTLWVGVTTGLWRWNPGPPIFHELSAGLGTLQAFARGDHGEILVGSNSGIWQLAAGLQAPFRLPGLARVDTGKLLRDRDGGLWVGTRGRGLLHLHRGRTDVFAQSDGLSGDSINRLFEDREGNIWVATTNGLDRFRELAVATISTKQGLSTVAVGSVQATSDGSVWLGTRDGLNRWKDGEITTYGTGNARARRGVNASTRSNDGPVARFDVVQAPFESASGRIWAATLQGIDYLANDRLIPVKGVPGGVVNAIVEDKAGDLWIANLEHGLVRLSLSNYDVQQIPWARLGLDPRAVHLIADHVQGGLWLGSIQGGIAYFADGQIRASYAAADGLGEGSINDFQWDQDGALWVATEGGLSRLKNGRFATLSSKSGLPCDTVHWLIKDDTDSAWLYLACGLVRIAQGELNTWATDPTRTIHPTVFDASDGVRLHPFLTSNYSPRVAKSSDGRLWFVSGDGVSVLDPRHLPFNNLPPPVHIEQVIADRKPYDMAVGGIQLPALIRDLQIDYTALSLVAPEKNRFRVKLEGWDREWQDVGTRRQAYYGNLPPRTYRFRVIASNNSGVWNETGAALDFSIAPAYYQTGWFRTLAVVTSLSLLWSAYRIRLRVIERHQAEITALNESLMKAQEQERTRIAGELHDGVMQQISALSLMLGTARRKIHSDVEAKAEIRDVQKKLIQVGTEVRQLSHDLHPASLKDGGLPDALRAYCDEFSRVRRVSVSCDADNAVRELSRGAALALYRIAQEALGNVATHGAATHVDVRLTRSNGRVSLTVSDDGKGFDPDQIASGGLGLINMRERTRQLNGTFALDSEPGRGTTVRVTIPFRRAA